MNPYANPAGFKDGLEALHNALNEAHYPGITAAVVRHLQHTGVDAEAHAAALLRLQTTLGDVLADTKIGPRSTWYENERPAAYHIACRECAGEQP